MSNIDINVPLTNEEILAYTMSLKRKDFITELGGLTPRYQRDGKGWEFPVHHGRFESHTFPATEEAISQLCGRWKGLDPFRQGMEELGYHEPQEAALRRVVLEEHERKVVLRTIQPNGERLCRAVVSDRYQPIDDDMVLPPILAYMNGVGGWTEVPGGGVSVSRTRLRWRSLERIAEVRGRELFAGIDVSNSEVARGCYRVGAFLFDAYCSNGMIMGFINLGRVEYRHVGPVVDQEFGWITTPRITEEKLAEVQAQALAAVKAAINSDDSQSLAAAINRTLEQKVPVEHAEAFIKRVCKEVRLTQKEAQLAWEAYDDGGDQYAVQACITRAAQDVRTLTQRWKMEEAGGQVMQLGRNQWKAIVNRVEAEAKEEAQRALT